MSLYLIVSVILGVTLTNEFIAIATPINTTNLELYELGQTVITNSFFSNVSFKGWGRLILVSALLAAFITAMHQFVIPIIVEKFKGRKVNENITIFFPVGLVVLGVISVILLVSDTGVTKLLPNSLRVRVETINFQQHSVLERGTLLDFDLSFVYLACLVFLCFGGMAAAIPFADIKWLRKN